MSYHNINTTSSTQPQQPQQTIQQPQQNILTYINGEPLFRTIQQALDHGQSLGLLGYHTHTFEGTIGYMAGFNHLQATTRNVEQATVKKIKSLTVSLATIPSDGETRTVSIEGENNASFILQIVNGSNQFYNFITRSFVSVSSPQTILRRSILGNRFNTNVSFPSGGSSYNLILISDPNDPNSVLDLSKGNGAINKKINQVNNSTISFSLVTPSNTTGSPIKLYDIDIDRDFTVTNVSTDANGFGLVLDRQPVESDFVFRQTQTVNGATSSSIDVVLDSVTDISVGMVLTGVSSGSLTGTPVVKAVDTKTLTVSLSSAQSFADGITLTFDAIGFKSIAKAIGVSMSLQSATATAPALTKIVRTAISSSTTINVEGTYGIAKGATFSGPDVDNSSANTVQSVSASSTAGSFVCQVNQTLEENQKILFKGCSQTVDVATTLNVKRYPSSNRTISILLDNFITPGVGS